MRKIVLYIAVSLDGYIAKPDGSVAWLEDPDHTLEGEDFGYYDFYASIDTTLMGNNTYKEVLGYNIPFPYPDKTNFVFSRTANADTEHVRFVSENIIEFVQKLRARNGKNIWLIGGGQVNSLLLKNDLIDQVILTVIPQTLGAGIPLFVGESGAYKFKLENCQSFANGFVQLDYMRK